MGQMPSDVLVIGAGIAGIEASLLLSKAGRKVHLVERTSFTGGTSVLFEQVYPTFECATCMLAPRQQDLLQDNNVHLMTLAEVKEVQPSPEGFQVTILQYARYINAEACIGCGACYDPCPVTVPNEAEQGLGTRKAVFTPFPGALPNVPMIDQASCLHLQGQECLKCKEACVFEAVDLEQKDQQVQLKVAAIIVAVGSQLQDLGPLTRYGYASSREVYSALEFERLFASNGPTSGKIVMRNGSPPRSVALIHCAGREESGYCSGICCLYLLKFNHYLREKLPEVRVHEFYSDLTIPGQTEQRFCKKMTEGGTELVRSRDLKVEDRGEGLAVVYKDVQGVRHERPVDMVVLAPSLEPRASSSALANVLGISTDPFGYIAGGEDGPTSTTREGIFVIGTAHEPKGIDAAVNDAYAAVAKVLAVRGGG